MLVSTRVENFKAFSDSGEINLRPLTFLMGPNSSGKTSLIDALVVLRQTLGSQDRTRQLISEGDILGVGSFQDFVFDHDSSRNLRIRFTFDLSEARSRNFGRMHVNLARVFNFANLNIKRIDCEVEFSQQPRTHRVFPLEAL